MGIAEDQRPQCKYWDKKKLVNWLYKNPVTSLLDREFLIHEEQKLYNMLDQAAREKEASVNTWSNLVWIRLYLCLYDERARPFFLSKDDVLDRQELDAHKHEDRPPTLFEKVAELVNDKENVYQLEAWPDLHHVFAKALTVSADIMPGKVSAEDVKRRLAESCARLLKIITNWDLSGNGFGQRTRQDENFGHMEEEQLEEETIVLDS
jgi:hypothetical protein